MSLYLGNNLIAGSSDKIYNANNLLDFKWSDHLISDMSWLRADTFSWQDGTVYNQVYSLFVTSIQDATEDTSQGVNFYKCENGLRIALANEEDNIISAYNNDGIAWYYILDTENQRFKLPRTKYGFVGLRDEVGNFVPQDVKLPNITGAWNAQIITSDSQASSSGALVGSGSYGIANIGVGSGWQRQNLSFDASRSSSVYSGNGSNTNIQQKATQMYLYFYVGQFSQTAIEQTAGITSAQLNNKVDLDASNLNTQGKSYVSGLGMPSDRYIDLTLGASEARYTAPANGWVQFTQQFSNAYGATISAIASDDNDTICMGTTGNTEVANIFIPVKREQLFKVFYYGTQASSYGVNRFRFIYAEGEE